MKLSYNDRFDKVWYMNETRHDNDVIDLTSGVYIEIKTKLS